MNIIAQFIWTISDALGVVGLLIMLGWFGVAYVWAKLETRRRRLDFERRKNVKDEGRRTLDLANTNSNL